MNSKGYKKSHISEIEKEEFFSILKQSDKNQREFAEKLKITSRTITNWKEKGVPYFAYLIIKQTQEIKELKLENAELREKLDNISKIV